MKNNDDYAPVEEVEEKFSKSEAIMHFCKTASRLTMDSRRDQPMHWTVYLQNPSMPVYLSRGNLIKKLIKELIEEIGMYYMMQERGAMDFLKKGRGAVPLLYELGKGLVATDLSNVSSYGKGPFDVFLPAVLEAVPGLLERKGARFDPSTDPRVLVGDFQRHLLKNIREHAAGKAVLPPHMADNSTNFLLSVWKSMNPDTMSYTDICRMFAAIGDLLRRWCDTKPAVLAEHKDIVPRVLTLVAMFMRKGTDLYPKTANSPLVQSNKNLLKNLQKTLQLELGQWGKLHVALMGNA